MGEQLSKDRYDEEIRTQANVLESYVAEAVENGEYDDPEKAAFDLAREILNGHGWFSTTDPELHGEIIAFSEANPENYVDLDAYTEGKSPEEIVLAVAALCFEGDVTGEADVSHIG